VAEVQVSDTDRINALEERVAFQDRAIEDLNAVITDQWQLIETLRRRVDRLEAEFAEVELSGRESNAVERKPPHY
jgi:SlyX protein